MMYKKLLSALLLASMLLMSACSSDNDQKNDDSDTASDTPVITQTEPPEPVNPVLTEELTETEPPQTTEVLTETEPLPETTVPLPEPLPVLPEEPTTEVPEVKTETETEAKPIESPSPAPLEIAKPLIDITDQVKVGGGPVSGQIASAQSEHIRLLLDYSVEQMEDGTVTLVLDVGLSCYELWCSEKQDMGTITVNGVSHTFSTDAIDHMVNEKTYIPFLTQSYNGTGGQTAAIEVSWCFNGNYGGTDIGTLTAGMTLRYGTDDASLPAVTEPVDPPAEETTAERTEPEEPIPSEQEQDTVNPPTDPSIPAVTETPTSQVPAADETPTGQPQTEADAAAQDTP